MPRRRSRPRHPETIVISLSVNIDDENQKAMVKAGATLLMSKEAAIDQLHETIHAAAQLQQMCSRIMWVRIRLGSAGRDGRSWPVSRTATFPRSLA